MGAYRGRRVFRAGRAVVILTVLVTGLFALGAVVTYGAGGWNWVSVALACMTVFSVGGIAESLILTVRLTEDALVVTDLLGRRSYRLTDIAGVHEAKGVSPVMLLADGRRVKLPDVGDNIGNSIRSWLKQS
jgi:hypothetical protein